MKILIVDDSTINNILLQNLLEENNFSVDTALNGLDAIEIISNEQINLILLDVMMPDFSGIDLLNYMKSNKIEIPVIVLTANISKDYKKKVFELGAKDYMNKPVKFDILLQKIRKVSQLV